MNDTEYLIRQLIEQARAGSREALSELLDRYRDHLHGIASEHITGPTAARLDASDVVQQTCLSVYKKIAEFDGQEPPQFAAWLRQIHERNISNAIRDQLHAQKRAADREERFVDGNEPAARQTSPSGRAIRNEEADRLARALEQLPDDERRALHLRYFEQQTLPQICEEMELTKDAVVWLMKRGMQRVRQFLGDVES